MCIGWESRCGSGLGHVMNIHTVLGDDHSFDPDEIAIMVTAYENALRDLQFVDREDPTTLTVAHRIIDLAKLGERNPARPPCRTTRCLRCWQR